MEWEGKRGSLNGLWQGVRLRRPKLSYLVHAQAAKVMGWDILSWEASAEVRADLWDAAR